MPGLSLALVVTIAIGVGSNAIVSGFIEGLAHPMSPARTPDHIVSIFAHGQLSDAGPLSDSEYQAIRSGSPEFAWVNAVRIAPLDVEVDGNSETVIVAGVMPDLAKALNLQLKGGAVLSDRWAATEFGDQSHGIGRTVRVNNSQLPITGIAPKTLEGLYRDSVVDIWMPFQEAIPQDTNPVRAELWVLASLRSGVSPSEAQRGISATLKTSGGVEVIPYSGSAPGTAVGLASIISLLNFLAGSVFLISCTNVASLLLGRAFKRSGETSLRVALGATRRALSLELLTDSAVLASAGGMLGLLLAMGAKRVIPNLLFEQDAERLIFVPPVASLITSSMVCVSVTVLAGMLPMVATVTDRPWMVLQQEQGTSSTRVVRLRAGLVVLQIALCCALVIFATLLFEGFQNALKTGGGQKLGDPILLTVQRPPLDFRGDYFKAVEKSVKSVPGIASVAWTTQLPGGQPTWQSFRIQPPSLALHEVVLDTAEFRWNDQGQPEQKATAGRLFEVRDESCRVAVVNGAAAAALSVHPAFGERIFDLTGTPIEIIGVVNTSSGDGGSRRPTIYFDPLNPNRHPSMKNVRFRAPAATSDIELNVNFVSRAYAKAFGLALISGHWLTDSEGYSGQCGGVGLVNQEAADLFFGGKPLGAEIIDQNGTQIEIIGVVRSQNLGVFQKHAEPTVFIPAWWAVPLRMTLVLSAPEANEQKMAELRSNIESVPGHDSARPQLTTLDKQLARSAFAPLRIATLIALASALAALTVSMIGVFSLQGHLDRERRKVLALHLAFGAKGWRILFKSLIESGRLVFVGCVAGTLLSIVLPRVLLSGAGLIGQPPFRAWLFAVLLPALAILISGAIAAVRSLSVHPIAILRDR
ncbi:MAG TPA: ABC transporter permease [Terracidiphilus sp.]